MAALPLTFTPSTKRVFTASASKSVAGGKEEKSLLDFILGSLTKEDQMLETDPILKKVEGKGTTGTTGSRKGTVEVPQKKKNGGFGGLFAKFE